MSIDRILLYVHILAAIAWMGAGLTLALLGMRARQTGTEMKLIAQMDWIGARIGGPSVLTMLATGVAMVIRSGAWQFSQGWIVASLVMVALLFLVGVGFHMPQYRRIHAAAEEFGSDSTQARKLAHQSFRAAQIEVVLLAVVVLLMVFKPGI